jgi:hypothetical protein
LIIEPLLLMLAFGVIILVLMYLNAGIIYDFHYNLKKDNNPLSKIISFNLKYLDDKPLWVKHYRIKLLMFLGFLVCFVLIGYFESK